MDKAEYKALRHARFDWGKTLIELQSRIQEARNPCMLNDAIALAKFEISRINAMLEEAK